MKKAILIFLTMLSVICQPASASNIGQSSIIYDLAVKGIENSIPKDSLKQAQAAIKNGSLRILYVGDSLTVGANLFSISESYASQVDEQIRNVLPGVKVTSANYALGSRRIQELMNPRFVGAYPPSSDPSVNYWASWAVTGQSWLDAVKSFKPDLIVLAFGMNDSYHIPTDADYLEATNVISFMNTVKTWSPNPSVVLVSTILPIDDSSKTAQDQNIMQSIARATREAAKNNGVSLADANRLFNILVNSRDDVTRTGSIESNLKGFTDPSLWTGDTSSFTLAGSTLTPLDTASHFVSRQRPFYNGDIQFDMKPVNGTDKAWVFYRSYGSYGALILFVDPASGHISIYRKDTGELIGDVGGLSIPFNQNSNIKLEARGSNHTVYLNDTKVLNITTYKILNDGIVTIGSAQSCPVISNFSIVYQDSIRTGPLYTEADILGKSDGTGTGNGLNHPSSLGHALAYFPAFNGIIKELTR